MASEGAAGFAGRTESTSSVTIRACLWQDSLLAPGRGPRAAMEMPCPSFLTVPTLTSFAARPASCCAPRPMANHTP